jgi:hypothetical protein
LTKQFLYYGKIITVIVVFGVLGNWTVDNYALVKSWLIPMPYVYQSTSHNEHETRQYKAIQWQDLIPDSELALLEKYQVRAPTDLASLSDQVLNSINAAGDQAYQSALISTNTVADFDRQLIEIPGFVVPLDFHQNQDPQNLFFVPYFGACIHFPPPPPNQMFFVQLEEGFSEFVMDQPYTIRGRLNRALFEDPMGTSAYTIEVDTIIPFMGQPDTFRKH